MWIMATADKFTQYGLPITTQRQLSNGLYIMHFNLTGGTDDAISAFLVAIRPDTEVQILTDEQMDAVIADEPTND